MKFSFGRKPACSIAVFAMTVIAMAASGARPAIAHPADELALSAAETFTGLKAAKAQAQASAEAVGPAGAYADPVVSLGVEALPADSRSFDREDMTQQFVAVTQMIPFPGKLGLKRDIARHDADYADREYMARRADFIRDVKETYFELYYIRRSIEILERSIVVMRDFLTIAISKYEVGRGSQAEVIKSQTEISKLDARLIKLRQQNIASTARMNYLAGADAMGSVRLEPPAMILAATDAELQSAALERMPELRQAEAMLEAGRAEHELARRDFLPDFDFKIQYGRRSDTPMPRPDLLSGMVGITIPIFKPWKQDKTLAEKTFRLEAAGQELESTRERAKYETAQLASAVRAGIQTAAMFEHVILIQSRQTLESAIAGYRVDKVGYKDLLEAELALLDYELEFESTRSETGKNLARLERITGQIATSEAHHD